MHSALTKVVPFMFFFLFEIGKLSNNMNENKFLESLRHW